MITRLTCWIALFCLLPIGLYAQSTESDINARLMNTPLYLRGFWRNDKLNFDPTGHLIGKSGLISFTLCGFDLTEVQLTQDKLILKGRRIGLELANGRQTRVPIGESMHIAIAASPTGEYGPALDAIFANGLADLVPSLPSYWKTYAIKNFIPADNPTASPAVAAASATPTPAQQSLPSAVPPSHIDIAAVKAPRLLSGAEPDFNEVARSLHYGGTVLINFRVIPNGTVATPSILHALGIGLDEDALAAVQQYRFAPATENGKPITVEININVSLQAF